MGKNKSRNAGNTTTTFLNTGKKLFRRWRSTFRKTIKHWRKKLEKILEDGQSSCAYRLGKLIPYNCLTKRDQKIQCNLYQISTASYAKKKINPTYNIHIEAQKRLTSKSDPAFLSLLGCWGRITVGSVIGLIIACWVDLCAVCPPVWFSGCSNWGYHYFEGYKQWELLSA